MTGLVITISGVYTDPEYAQVTGVILTSHAFATVIDWFPTVLAFAVVLFAYSTIITWSYYGERSWLYLFGEKNLGLFHILFISATLLGGMTTDIALIVDFSDLMILSMAIPNLIGLYLMQSIIVRETTTYQAKLKNGMFKTYTWAKHAKRKD
jgi:AGCS family alanine or glycine:cation symporter